MDKCTCRTDEDSDLLCDFCAVKKTQASNLIDDYVKANCEGEKFAVFAVNHKNEKLFIDIFDDRQHAMASAWDFFVHIPGANGRKCCVIVVSLCAQKDDERYAVECVFGQSIRKPV